MPRRTCDFIRPNGVRCKSQWVRKDDTRCNAHSETFDFRRAQVKGGKRSGTKRLSKSLKRLIELLAQGENSLQGTTLSYITPEPWVPPETCTHVLAVKGSSEEDPLGYARVKWLHCVWQCEDLSAFAEALRMYRIRYLGDTTYMGWVRGVYRSIPLSEIELLRRLTSKMPDVVREGR